MRSSILIVLLGGCNLVFKLEDAKVDAATDAIAACPDDYVFAQSAMMFRFRVVSIAQDWTSAEMDCVDDAIPLTHLATPDSAAKLTVMAVTAAGSNPFWVGAARNADDDEKMFTTVTGDPVPLTPTMWGANQPDNGNADGTEFAVHLESGRLNDKTPGFKSPYVCECDGRPIADGFQF